MDSPYKQGEDSLSFSRLPDQFGQRHRIHIRMGFDVNIVPGQLGQDEVVVVIIVKIEYEKFPQPMIRFTVDALWEKEQTVLAFQLLVRIINTGVIALCHTTSYL